MMKAVINGVIVTPTGILEDHVLLFADGKITDFAKDVPEDAEVIDAKGLVVAPGFVDVHIHGSGGADVMDGTPEAIATIAAEIAKYGTTSFLPTTLTMGRDDVYKSLEVVRELKGKSLPGAEVLGAHLEGPFINPKFKGAQNESFVVAPDYDWIADFNDVIKLVTYAPEMDNDFIFTKTVKANTDVTLSIGHSDASYDLASAAIACGCSHITHLFNAMTGLHHRDPGVVGAALTHDVFTELIADEIHVNQKLFQFVLDNKGNDRLVLITDSMRAGCMKDGTYEIGGQRATVEKGAARLSDGTLAGSVLTLNKAVYNLHRNTNADLVTAIHLASLNPATSIKVANRKGSLEIGKDADIIFLDEQFDCHLTIVNGVVVYQNT